MFGISYIPRNKLHTEPQMSREVFEELVSWHWLNGKKIVTFQQKWNFACLLSI